MVAKDTTIVGLCLVLPFVVSAPSHEIARFSVYPVVWNKYTGNHEKLDPDPANSTSVGIPSGRVHPAITTGVNTF